MRPNFLTIAAILLVLLALYVQACASLDGDKLLAMQVAHLWLSGKRLYVDLMQLNPPTIYVLYAVALNTGLPDGAALYSLVTLLSALSVWVLSHIIAHHPRYEPHFALPHALYLCLLFIVWPNPAHYGDREHLFFLLTLPFIVQQMPSLRYAPLPKTLSLTTALMAAVGFAIKPYCLLVYGLVQAGVWLHTRKTTPTQRLLAVLLVAEMLIIVLYSPEYFTTLVPLALASYKQVNQGIGVIYFIAVALFYLLMPLADFRPRRSSALRADVLYFMATLAAYAAYILCNNGWEYTFYPFNAMVLYFTAWLALEHAFLAANAAGEKEKKQSRMGMRACQVAIGFHVLQVLGLYAAAWVDMQQRAGLGKKLYLQTDDMVAYIRTHNVKSYGVLAATFTPWPILSAQTGATQQTRYSELWPLPKWISGDEAYRKGHVYLVDGVAASMADDLTRNQPEIVFVDASPEFHVTGKHVDLPQLLAEHSASFAKAWSGYRLAFTSDYCGDKNRAGCHYDIYEKIK